MGKDSPSPPPAPDYASLAQQQGTANIDAARTSAKLSNPNIVSPLGTRTITYGGGAPTFNQAGWDSAMKAYEASKQTAANQPSNDLLANIQMLGGNAPGTSGNSSSGVAPNQADYWQTSGDPDQSNMEIKLSPEQQALYDKQTALSQGLLGLGQNSLNQTAASLGQPQDFGSVQDIADQSYNMQTSRLDPQWQQSEAAQKAQLANQGLAPGGEAYDNAMRTFSQGKNDAYNQARLSSISTMPQTFQLSSAQRMQPLTELNAIRSGAQPQMPQFQPISAVNAGAAPVMQAGLAQSQYNQGLYNADVASQNSMMGGLMSLGGALGSAMISDRRLKRDIVKVSDDPRGFGWYSFRYLWSDRPQIGVMADEVPHASVAHPSGFFMVDYGRL